MGNSSSCSNSTAATDQSNPTSAQMGTSVYGSVVQIGCGTAGSVSNYVTCPDGWQNNGEGDTCHYCTSTNGTACNQSAGCSSLGCATVGQRLQCKLTSYQGDKTSCCTTGASGSSTCDPNFTPTNYSAGYCDSAMDTYCTANSYSNWNSTNCQTWYGQYSQTAINDMVGYCTLDDNITLPACLAFSKKYPGLLDTVAAAYCTANPTLQPFCACLTPPTTLTDNPNLTAVAIKPYCYYAPCSSGASAYVTETMLQETCSSITICNQEINIGTVTDSNIASINISCVASNTTVLTEIENFYTTAITYAKNNLQLVVGIVLCLLLLLLIWLL